MYSQPALWKKKFFFSLTTRLLIILKFMSGSNEEIPSLIQLLIQLD